MSEGERLKEAAPPVGGTARYSRAVLLLAGVVIGVLLLAFPGASWLAYESEPGGGAPDVIYLVAGSGDQDRRIGVLADTWSRFVPARVRRGPEIWIGNDSLISGWSRRSQANLLTAEWAQLKILARVNMRDAACVFSVLPGGVGGTDGEMRVLAAELARRPDVRRVVLVTSPYHSRRVRERILSHVDPRVRVVSICGPVAMRDRLPWVVLGEFGKLGRDQLVEICPFLDRLGEARVLGWSLLAGCVLLLVYGWVVYPWLLAVMVARRRVVEATAGAGACLPRVAVVLAAYREEAVIAARLRNLLALDYPAGQLEIWLGVDGRDDGTGAVAREAAGCQAAVHVVEFPVRRGKAAVLKDLVAQSGAGVEAAPILVFTDANTRFAPDAVRKLVARFDDPAVGGVCGRLVLEPGAGAGTQENVYWEREARWKERESAVDSCLGANGAIYAVRRSLFWDGLPANTIVDDFVIGMKVREQGYRMVFEPAATGSEELPERVADEWRRRVRIGAGVYQALVLCRRCLLPRYGRFGWMFWSHKGVRWFSPHLLVLAGVAAVWLPCVPGATWREWVPAVGGVGVLAAAAFGRLLRGVRGGRVVAAFRMVDYVVAMEAALFVGFLRFCRGNLKGMWERTERGASA